MKSLTLDELCEKLGSFSGKRIAFTFHSIGDRDSVGSAVALADYLDNATLVTADFLTNNAKKLLEYVGCKDCIEKTFPKDCEVI